MPYGAFHIFLPVKVHIKECRVTPATSKTIIILYLPEIKIYNDNNNNNNTTRKRLI